MSTSLVPRRRGPLDRKTAWGCFTTNAFVLPGLGSLAGGRWTGYGQMAFALGGLAMTASFGITFAVWNFAHAGSIDQYADDPAVYAHDIWIHARWALLGIALFVIGWLWAL